MLTNHKEGELLLGLEFSGSLVLETRQQFSDGVSLSPVRDRCSPPDPYEIVS